MKKSVRSVSGNTLERVLASAAGAISVIDSGKSTLDDLLDRAPEEFRRTLEHLLTVFYRYRKIIRGSWLKFCRKEPTLSIASLLDAAVTQCRFQSAVAPYSVVNVAVSLARSEHADKFVNAVLRSVLQEEFAVPATAQEILPDAVLKRWKKNFTADQIETFAILFTAKPSFTFRLCKGAEIPAKYTPVGAFEPFCFAAGVPGGILNSLAFEQGKYYIQDPAASMAISLAKAQLPVCRTLLDLCAAPGGKTLMAAELLPPDVQITASDISGARQKLTAENFARHRLDARIITADPEELTGEYDFLIADLPCSNTGVFRHRPDALWRFSEKSLAEVMDLQRHIAVQAARLTAPGRYLLLSTCSIEADENSALMEYVTGFREIGRRTLLPSEEHDGAFALLMQKLPC